MGVDASSVYDKIYGGGGGTSSAPAQSNAPQTSTPAAQGSAASVYQKIYNPSANGASSDYGFTKIGKISRGTPVTKNDIDQRMNDLFGAYDRLAASLDGRSNSWFNSDIQGRWNDHVKNSIMDMNNERLAIMKYLEGNDVEGHDYWKVFDDLGSAMVDMMSVSNRQTSLMKEFDNADDYTAWWEDQRFQQEWWQKVETANTSPFVAYAIEVNHQKEAQAAYDAAKKKLDQLNRARSADVYDDGSPMVDGNGNEVQPKYLQQAEQEFREAQQALNDANKRLGYAQKYLASDHDRVAQGASILSDNIEYRKQQRQAALDEGRFDENGNEVIASWDNQQREILDANRDSRWIDWSDSEPTERWTQQERDSYQAMLTINPEEAKQYAISLNQQYNSEAKQQKLQGAYAFGAGEGSSHWSKAGRGVASTAAFLAATPLSLKNYFEKVGNVVNKGYYVDSGEASLNDYAGAMVSGRAEQLNKDFSKLSIGGKGVGDLYQLANSALQSYVYGSLMGETGTLVAFFGSAANSGFDEAIQRGANGGQAAMMGLLSGVAETLGEKVSLENLLKPDLEASFIRNLLKQSGIEGSEEAFTDILNDFADRLVMGDRSKVKTELYAHMAEGMSYDEARRAAWGDFVKDVAWDAVGGFISGGMVMGLSYGAQSMTKYNGEYGADAKKLVEEAKSGSSQTSAEKKAIAKAEGKLKDNKSISMTDAGKLVKAGNRAAMVNATEAQIKAKGTELDDKTARSLANAIVAKNNREKLTSNQQRLLKNNQSIADSLLHDLSSKRITEQYDAIKAQAAYDSMTESERAHLFSEEATESEKQLRETLESAQLPGLSTWATQIGLRGEKAAVYGEKSQVAALNMRRDYIDAMNNVKSRMTVTYDHGQQGTIIGVERGEDGKVTAYTLDIGNGTVTVPADKLSLTKGQKAIAEIMTDDVYAGAKIKAMENGQNVVAYSNEFEAFAEVYGHASSKNNFEQAWAQFNENNKNLTLTEAQAKVAFEAGKNLRAVDRTTSTLSRRGTGAVSFDKAEFDGTEYKAPSEQEINEFKQSDRYKYLKAIAKSIGVDIVFYKGGALGANGQYLDGTVYLAIDASNSVDTYGQVEGYVMLTAAHELTHYIREASPAQFNKLRDFVVDHIIDKGLVDGKSMEQLFMEKRAQYAGQGAYSDIDSIMEEIVADACQVMLRDNNLVLELKGYDTKLHGSIRGRVLKFINQVRQAFLDTQGNQIANEFTMSTEAKAMDDVFIELQKIWNEGLVQAAHAEVAHYTEVENESGKTVMATDNAGHAQLSLKTYEDGGREKLEQFLDQRVQEGALDKTERDQMLQQMNELYEFCQKKAAEYTLFGEWSRAVVKTDPETGNAVFSVVKANGDYALNLDFSLICKKRRTLDAVFNQMIQDGIMDDFDMKEDSIAAINDIIRAHDFETACALCFVDSKRYRQAMVADSFVNMYNPLVRSMAPKGARIDFFNFGGAAYIQNTGAGIDTFDDSQLDFSKIDKVLETYGEKTVMYKIAQNLKEHPEDRKLVQRGDFMSSAGFDNINQNNKRILGLYNSKKGAGGPKASQSDVQYLSEILDQNRFNADAAYSVGGVRVQSFSDYVPRLVFDYLQMFADMSAKELPAHAYTKEAMFALQFGLMGIKTNMSLVPEVIADGVAPGLDANGNYAWRDGQSFGSTVYGGSQAFIEKCFDIIGQEYHGEDRLTAAQGFELAKAIQRAAGYTDNCGTIAVGVSNEHIRKLLADPDIRMVIPYHKSSLNHIVAVMTNIDKYKDYTSAQNTRKGGTMDKNGHYTGGSKITKSEDTFNFNDTLREFGDAKAAANAYLAWCDQNGYTPKFDDFRGEENYYKLLEDFSCYNESGMQTPQQGVSFTLPGTNSAFGDIQSIIELGLEEDAILQGNQDAAVPAIIEDIKKILPGMEQARRDAEAEKRRKAAERKAKKEAQGKLSLKEQRDIAVDAVEEFGLGEGRAQVGFELQVAAPKYSLKAGELVNPNGITYDGIGERYFAYDEGDRPPDLTPVKTQYRKWDDKAKAYKYVEDVTIKFAGDRPKNYEPARVGKAYKVMEQWPDGSVHPLFAGADIPIVFGEWQWGKGYEVDGLVKTMGLRPRYAWHISTLLPTAAHLMGVGDSLNPQPIYPSKGGPHPKGSKRVWVELEYDASTDYNGLVDTLGSSDGDVLGLMPFGGYYVYKEKNMSEWVLSSGVRFTRVLEDGERQKLLSDAGYNEYEAWQKGKLSQTISAQITNTTKAIAKETNPEKLAVLEAKLERLQEIHSQNPFAGYKAPSYTKAEGDAHLQEVRSSVASRIYDNPVKVNGKASLKKSNKKVNYDVSQEYYWARNGGIITNEHQRTLDEVVERIERGYKGYPKSYTGETIADGGDALMFVDDNYEQPTLSMVLAFDETDFFNYEYVKEAILRGYQTSSGAAEYARTIAEILLGQGSVHEYNVPVNRTNAQQINRGTGSNSRRNSRTASIRERLEAEGYTFDPVTEEYYDADGIALSHKKGKAQLKVTSTAERELNAKQRSLDRLARQNELLEQRVEYWRNQTKLSKDNARAHTEVEAFVKDLLARSDSITDRAAAVQQIQELANIVTSGRLTDANIDEVSGAAYALAEKILDESEVVVDDSMVQARNDIIDYLKHHTITLSEGDKTFLKQRFGSVSDFRKQGSNNAFRFGPNGISIDQAYQDIRSRDGLQEMFPADMQAGDNQFEFIAKQLESFKETKANPHSANILEERNIVFNEIMDFLFDEDARIEKTFADKAQEKLDRKQQQVDRQKEQIGRQKATIAEQKERIKGQREQLDKQKQQAQAKIDAKQGTIDRQRDQLELERQRTANQKERVEKQKTKTTAQKAQTEKQKERVDKQKAKTAEQKAKTDEQKAKNADLKAQLAESRQEMKDLQKESKDRLKQLKASAMAEKEAAVMKEKADKWSKVDSVRKMYQARAKAAQQRRANTEMRGKIRDLHAEMSNRLRHSTEKSYVPAEFRASMAEILQMVNLDSGRSKALAARINALNVEYQAIKDHSEYGIAYDETIGNMITDLAKMLAGKKDTSIYNLTGAELEAVYNTMKAIDYTARFAAKLVAYNYNKDIFRIGVDMQREVELSSKAGGNLFNKYYFASMRPETFFQRMAGYAKNSTWSAMSDMLNEGQRKQTQLMMEGAQFFEELMNNDKLLREMTDPKKVVDIGLKDSEGNAVEVTMDIALKIYMDLMAEDNTRHIMYGGLIVPNIKEYYKGHMSESYGLGSKQVKGYSPELWALQDKLNKASSEAERAAIEVEIDQAEAAARNWVIELSSTIRALMGDYEKQWVDSAIKFFEWSKKNLNDTSNAVWGFDKGNVEFYVPIHTSQDYRQASFENLKRDFTLEGSGFTKARVMSKSPMQAEGIIDVVSTHCNNIAKYCGMMPATRNFSKVFGTTISSELNSLQRSIDAKFGSAAIKYIDNLMTDLQSSRQATVGGMGQTIDGAINWMRGNMAAASLTMNLGTALGQTASLPTAAAVIGYAPIIKSFADAKNNPMLNEQARDEIAQWSPLLWYRMQGYFDRDVGDLRSSNSIAAQAYDKLGFLTKWIETMDGLTVGQLWYAAQYYVEDQTDLERGTDEFMRETAKVFNKVVEQTQPNYTTFQRPDVLRDPSAFVKVTTMFMTQRLQNLNIMYDAAGKYNRYVKDFRNGKNGVTEYDVKEAKLGLVRAATSQLAAAAMIVLFKFVANALLYNMKPYRDDDDELTKESIISNLVRLTAESLISNFLFGTELYEFARAMITGEKYYGISLSGIDTFTDFLTAISNTRAKMGGDDKEKTMAALMALAKSVATLCGIPASNIQKFYNAIAYRINDAEKGNGRWSFESEITRKDSYYHNKMYEALVAKDRKAIETLNERYATKAERNSEMKKQIVARFKNDTLTDQEAVKQLMDMTDMSEYDAEREIAHLKCEKEQGFKYEELKQQYIDSKITRSQAIEYDQKYGLYDEKSAMATVKKWTLEKDTGYEYDKLQQYIAAKDLTEEQAIAYRIKYGGQEEEDALLTVSKWMCEIETDIPYDQLEEVFAEGGITRAELKRCYMEYGLKDEETAEGIVQKREFIGTDDELEDVTVARAKAYFEYFPDGDMDKRLYLQAQSDIYDIRADVNSKGKTISGSALKKKLVYIDSMSLQPWQKTAMAHAVGITDKQLTKYKAKWI